LIGRFDELRLFRATPPAIPANAAPPARSGAFAFDASCETFSVAVSTGPLEDWVLGLDRDAVEDRVLEDRVLVLDRDALAPLRLLLDFLVLGRPLLARLLEDRVV